MWLVLGSAVGLVVLVCIVAFRWAWKEGGSLFVQGYHNIDVDHTCHECRGTGYVPSEMPGTVTRCDNCYNGMMPADPHRFTRIPLAFPGRKWY